MYLIWRGYDYLNSYIFFINNSLFFSEHFDFLYLDMESTYDHDYLDV